MEDGSEKPTFSDTKWNYAHIEKKGLTLVFVIKKLNQYLYGHCFTIFTAHKLLLGLFTEYKSILPIADRVQH